MSTGPIKALPDVRRGLDALKISWTESEDAEDDDVIATLVSTAPARRDVLIMSGDRDMTEFWTRMNVAIHRAPRRATIIRRGQR
jgi:DNA polymerase-1